MSFWTLEWTSAHIWACAVTNPPATCFSLFHRVIPYFKFGIHYSSFLYIYELQERSLHNSNSVITCLSADISDFQKSLFDLPFFGGVKKPLCLKIWRFIRHFQLLNNSAIMHYKLVLISNSKPKLKGLLLSPKKPPSATVLFSIISHPCL